MILVSACLVGVKCRYDGRDNTVEYLKKLWESGKVLAVCPEVLGELQIPRSPAEIKYYNNKKKVINSHGEDVTTNFFIGAEKTLKIAVEADIKIAVLKSKSPSCGNKNIYDGTFSGRLIEGKGITVQVLEEHGIKVYNENEIKEFENVCGEL